MSAGIPVTGVSELVLEVVDLEAAEQFYSEVLGLPVVERWPHRDAVWLMAGDRTRIGLWRPQVGVAGGRGGIHVHYAMHLGLGLRSRRSAHSGARLCGARRAVSATQRGWPRIESCLRLRPRRQCRRALELGRRQAPRLKLSAA